MGSAFADEPAPPQPAGKVPFFPKDQIKPGLIGYTYTVLQGAEIVPVRTEVLGVAESGLAPGLDMIVGKLVDAKTAVTGAVHGMSGSPLYIDGKLVGALSRRIAAFEKDGHCGFTPIEDMMAVDAKLRAAGPAPAAPARGGALGSASPGRTRLPEAALGGGLLGGELARHAAGVPRAEPLAVPLSIQGLNQHVWEAISKPFRLSDSFWFPVQGGTGGDGSLAKSLGPEALQPGAAAAAVLMTGDVSLAGTGTLTWRDGDRVLAFGHPMVGVGNDRFGLGTAEIITTIPSYMRPFKMANQGNLVGTVTEDRWSAIGGRVGPVPELAAYQIERRHDGQMRGPLSGGFLPHPQLTPMFVQAAFTGAVLNNDDISKVLSMRVRGELQIQGHTSLRMDGDFGGEDFDLMTAVSELVGPVMALYRQEAEELTALRLDLKVETSEKPRKWFIEQLRADRDEVEAGSSVRVQLELLEQYGGRTWQTIEVPLPENLRAGSFTVRVLSADALNQASAWRRIFDAKTVEEMILAFNRRRLQNQLYVQVITMTPGEIVADREMPALPGSVLGVMRGGNRSEPPRRMDEQVWYEQHQDFPGIVEGRQELVFRIKE